LLGVVRGTGALCKSELVTLPNREIAQGTQ